MTEPIRRRADVDDCACLRCRELDPAVARRSIAGDVLWGLDLLRRVPALPLFAVTLVALDAAVGLAIGDPALSLGPVDVPIRQVLLYAALFVGFRALVATVTAAVLSGRPPAVDGRGIRHAVRRLPALLGVTAGTWVVVVLSLAAAMLASMVAVGLDYAVGTGLVRPEVFDGPVAPVWFGVPIVFATFKLWLAPEICVAGGYGPLASLRTSWAITSVHRRRIAVLVGGFVLSLFGPQALDWVLAGGSGFDAPVGAALSLAADLLQGVTYTLLFAVGTQVYVRAALTGASDGAATGR